MLDAVRQQVKPALPLAHLGLAVLEDPVLVAGREGLGKGNVGEVSESAAGVIPDQGGKRPRSPAVERERDAALDGGDHGGGIANGVGRQGSGVGPGSLGFAAVAPAVLAGEALFLWWLCCNRCCETDDDGGRGIIFE